MTRQVFKRGFVDRIGRPMPGTNIIEQRLACAYQLSPSAVITKGVGSAQRHFVQRQRASEG